MEIDKSLKKKIGVYSIEYCGLYYIGSSINLYGRLKMHFNQLKRGIHHSKYMQRVYNKYGEESFSINILNFFDNKDESLLRRTELLKIKEYNSVFNSTTPIEYRHSEKMKNRIRKTLEERFKNKELHPRYNKGRKFNIYDISGNLLYQNVSNEFCTNFLNLSNRSTINNAIRKHQGFYFSKNYEYLIMLSNKTLIDYMNYIKNNFESIIEIPVYKITDGNYYKIKHNLRRFIPKILKNEFLIYESNWHGQKSFYTFIGLFNNAVQGRNFLDYQ